MVSSNPRGKLKGNYRGFAGVTITNRFTGAVTSWVGRNIFIIDVSQGKDRNRSSSRVGVIQGKIAKGAKVRVDGGILGVVER